MVRRLGNIPTKALIAGFAVGAVDPFLQQTFARFGLGVSDDIVRILAGIALPAFGIGRAGILRDILQAEVVLGAAGLARGFGLGSTTMATAPVSTATVI